jgi:glutamine amidotransferase
MVGARLNRTLWYLEREGLVHCPICGETHVHHDPRQPYRAVEIASEPITGETWHEVPNGTAFAVDPDYKLHMIPMGPLGLQAAGALSAEAPPESGSA